MFHVEQQSTGRQMEGLLLALQRDAQTFLNRIELVQRSDSGKLTLALRIQSAFPLGK